MKLKAPLIFAESVRTPAFCILILVYFDIFEDKSSQTFVYNPNPHNIDSASGAEQEL